MPTAYTWNPESGNSWGYTAGDGTTNWIITGGGRATAIPGADDKVTYDGNVSNADCLGSFIACKSLTSINNYSGTLDIISGPLSVGANATGTDGSDWSCGTIAFNKSNGGGANPQLAIYTPTGTGGGFKVDGGTIGGVAYALTGTSSVCGSVGLGDALLQMSMAVGNGGNIGCNWGAQLYIDSGSFLEFPAGSKGYMNIAFADQQMTPFILISNYGTIDLDANDADDTHGGLRYASNGKMPWAVNDGTFNVSGTATGNHRFDLPLETGDHTYSGSLSISGGTKLYLGNCVDLRVSYGGVIGTLDWGQTSYYQANSGCTTAITRGTLSVGGNILVDNGTFTWSTEESDNSTIVQSVDTTQHSFYQDGGTLIGDASQSMARLQLKYLDLYEYGYNNNPTLSFQINRVGPWNFYSSIDFGGGGFYLRTNGCTVTTAGTGNIQSGTYGLFANMGTYSLLIYSLTTSVTGTIPNPNSYSWYQSPVSSLWYYELDC